MNDMQGVSAPAEAEPESAFRFEGSWREYLPIALTNLLLIVVTLGIYRFWAKARERRYLWSRTRFIDDTLEWTGTGKEMFIGFVVVMLVLGPLFFGIRLLIEALTIRGQGGAVALIALVSYAFFIYLVGVAQFRAIRYRLSRSYWHGIRGGSDDGGWSYGYQYLWKTIAGGLVLGLLIPWKMASLWNDRWNRMSFGQHPIEAGASWEGLMGRWLLIYLVPIAGLILSGVAGGMLFAGVAVGSGGSPAAVMGAVFVAVVVFYLAFLLASLSYYAAYYRQMVEETSWGGIDFRFTARTRDWLKLIFGTIGLIVVTLGFGFLFVGYRNWSFAVRHLEASGEINLDTLLQSQTAAPREAEGFADAFDIGAF
jgi:uncharacterized membrane protein YjgN (DUF898 family)